MTTATIDESTRTALNSLSRVVIQNINNTAYGVEILSYGVDAIAHFHLMSMAKDVAEGRLKKEKFIETYGIQFKGDMGFLGSLDGAVADGIFIPQQRVLDENGIKIWYFDLDYGNRIVHESWTDKEYARQLLDRQWQPSDFENPELVEQGIRFGRDMWQTCSVGFNKRKNAQSSRINELAEKLISYYSAIANAH